MKTTEVLTYQVSDSGSLNASYMSFVKDDGLFVPTAKSFKLGEIIPVDLILPEEKNALRIEGKVIWIAPTNDIFFRQGVGIKIIGRESKQIWAQLKKFLDPSRPHGEYTM